MKEKEKEKRFLHIFFKYPHNVIILKSPLYPDSISPSHFH